MNFLTFLVFSFHFDIRHFLKLDHNFLSKFQTGTKRIAISFENQIQIRDVGNSQTSKQASTGNKEAWVQSCLSSLHFLKCMQPANLDLEADFLKQPRRPWLLMLYVCVPRVHCSLGDTFSARCLLPTDQHLWSQSM